MASMILRVYRPFCVKTWMSSSLASRAASAIAHGQIDGAVLHEEPTEFRTGLGPSRRDPGPPLPPHRGPPACSCLWICRPPFPPPAPSPWVPPSPSVSSPSASPSLSPGSRGLPGDVVEGEELIEGGLEGVLLVRRLRQHEGQANPSGTRDPRSRRFRACSSHRASPRAKSAPRRCGAPR